MATSLRVKVVIVRRDSILALGRDLSPRGSVILGAQVLDSRQRFVGDTTSTYRCWAVAPRTLPFRYWPLIGYHVASETRKRAIPSQWIELLVGGVLGECSGWWWLFFWLLCSLRSPNKSSGHKALKMELQSLLTHLHVSTDSPPAGINLPIGNFGYLGIMNQFSLSCASHGVSNE